VVIGRPIRTPKTVFDSQFILTKTGERTNNYFIDAASGPPLRATRRNERKKDFIDISFFTQYQGHYINKVYPMEK